MNIDSANPKNNLIMSAWSKCSCDNSCPPLNPIENSKYNEINLEVWSGMDRSLFMSTDTIPRIKKSSAGFVKFSNSKLRFMAVFKCV